MNFSLPVLAPSILAADFANLEQDITSALEGGAEWIHCDIMDGHFVPNISFGPAVVKKAAAVADEAFIDVHLMIEHPEKYISDFIDAGADLISVHYEACVHLHRTLTQIKQQGAMCGVVINPATSLSSIDPILEEVDLVLLMSVNPGFGGQSFIEKTYERLQKLSEIRDEKGLGFLIQVDGGVNLKNIRKVANAGADVLVAGSSVFSAKDVTARVQEIREKLSDL